MVKMIQASQITTLTVEFNRLLLIVIPLNLSSITLTFIIKLINITYKIKSTVDMLIAIYNACIVEAAIEYK